MSVYDYSPYLRDHGEDEDCRVNWGLTNSDLRILEERQQARESRGKEDCSRCRVHPTWEGDLCIHCHCSQRRSR